MHSGSLSLGLEKVTILVRKYAELFHTKGLVKTALAAAFARLATTMIPVALVLAVIGAGFSVELAGFTAGAYALGNAVGNPTQGRLVDRFAPISVFCSSSIVLGVSLSIVGLRGSELSPFTIIMCAVLGGLSTSPVGASMRALWPTLLPAGELRQRAFTFESTLSEFLFILGPAVVALVSMLWDPQIALLLATMLFVVGAFGFSTSGLVRSLHRQRTVVVASARTPPSASRRIALAAIMTSIGLTAALSSAVFVAVTGFMQYIHAPLEIGVVGLSLQSTGSVVGGVIYGTFVWNSSSLTRYIRVLSVLTLGLATIPIAFFLAQFGVDVTIVIAVLIAALLLSGIPIAPAGSEEFQLVGEVVPPNSTNLAFASVGSFIAIGTATGSAVVGFIAERFGVFAGLLLPSIFAALALALSVITRRHILRAITELRMNTLATNAEKLEAS